MMKKLHLSIWGYGADKKMTGEILQIKLSVQKLLMNIKESWKGPASQSTLNPFYKVD